MQNKDEQYFLQTYHRHKDMVYRIAYTYVGNPDDAKDILQDVFLKLYNTRKSFVEEVRRLPVKYRAVIYLHYYEGYSYKEIAEILNLRLSAVKMRAKRGREMLKLNLTVDSIERSME